MCQMSHDCRQSLTFQKTHENQQNRTCQRFPRCPAFRYFPKFHPYPMCLKIPPRQ
uniref:Uncharacterized protein n=1 Tax=viral metagenome TaxID=1070528 RepID=A0A6M3LIR0_9ZZZZ